MADLYAGLGPGETLLLKYIEGVGPVLTTHDQSVIYHFRADNSEITNTEIDPTVFTPFTSADTVTVTSDYAINIPDNLLQHVALSQQLSFNSLGDDYLYDEFGAATGNSYTDIPAGAFTLNGGVLAVRETGMFDILNSIAHPGMGSDLETLTPGQVGQLVFIPNLIDYDGSIETALENFEAFVFNAPDEAALRAGLVIDFGETTNPSEITQLSMQTMGDFQHAMAMMTDGVYAIVDTNATDPNALHLDLDGGPQWVKILHNSTVEGLAAQLLTIPNGELSIREFGGLADLGPTMAEIETALSDASAYGVARGDMTTEQIAYTDAILSKFIDLTDNTDGPSFYNLVANTLDFDDLSSTNSDMQYLTHLPIEVDNWSRPTVLANANDLDGRTVDFLHNTEMFIDYTDKVVSDSYPTPAGVHVDADYTGVVNYTLMNFADDDTNSFNTVLKINSMPIGSDADSVTLMGGDFEFSPAVNLSGLNSVKVDDWAYVYVEASTYNSTNFDAGMNAFVEINGTSGNENIVGTGGYDYIHTAGGDDILTGLGGPDKFKIIGPGDVIITDFSPFEVGNGTQENFELHLSGGDVLRSTDLEADARDGTSIAAGNEVNVDPEALDSYVFGDNDYAIIGDTIHHFDGSLTVYEKVEGTVDNPFVVEEVEGGRYGDIITFGIKALPGTGNINFESLDVKVDWIDGEYEFWGGFYSGTGIINNVSTGIESSGSIELISADPSQSHITIGSMANAAFSVADGGYLATFMLERVDTSGNIENAVTLSRVNYSDYVDGTNIPVTINGAPDTQVFNYDKDKIDIDLSTWAAGRDASNTGLYITDGSVTDGLTVVPVSRFGHAVKYAVKYNVSTPMTMTNETPDPAQSITIKGDIFDNSFMTAMQNNHDTDPNNTAEAVGGAAFTVEDADANQINFGNAIDGVDFYKKMIDGGVYGDQSARALLTRTDEVTVNVTGLAESTNPGSFTIAEFYALDHSAASVLKFSNDGGNSFTNIYREDISGQNHATSVDDGSDIAVIGQGIYENPEGFEAAIGSQDALGAFRIFTEAGGSYTPENIIAADFDASGSVDVMDVYNILNYAVNGYTDTGILPTWSYLSDTASIDTASASSVTFDNSLSMFVGQNTEINATAILRGDVNGNYKYPEYNSDVIKDYYYEAANWFIGSPELQIGGQLMGATEYDGTYIADGDAVSIARASGVVDGPVTVTANAGDNIIFFDTANSMQDVIDIIADNGLTLFSAVGDDTVVAFTYRDTEEVSVGTVWDTSSNGLQSYKVTYLGDLNGYDTDYADIDALVADLEATLSFVAGTPTTAPTPTPTTPTIDVSSANMTIMATAGPDVIMLTDGAFTGNGAATVAGMQIDDKISLSLTMLDTLAGGSDLSGLSGIVQDFDNQTAPIAAAGVPKLIWHQISGNLVLDVNGDTSRADGGAISNETDDLLLITTDNISMTGIILVDDLPL